MPIWNTKYAATYQSRMYLQIYILYFLQSERKSNSPHFSTAEYYFILHAIYNYRQYILYENGFPKFTFEINLIVRKTFVTFHYVSSENRD